MSQLLILKSKIPSFSALVPAYVSRNGLAVSETIYNQVFAVLIHFLKQKARSLNNQETGAYFLKITVEQEIWYDNNTK